MALWPKMWKVGLCLAESLPVIRGIGSYMTLRDLAIGETAVITAVGGEGALRQHLLDMGVIPGSFAKVIKFAPMGDPVEIQIHGYLLTLRLQDANRIEVEKREEEKPVRSDSSERIVHPGLGEEQFHVKGDGEELPAGTIFSFALVGNQNSGKTTLFNQLTGANQHVGNFPGVTVDRKDGPIKGHPDTIVTDLPGIYSMSPYSSEEKVSRNFVLNERPHAIIDIVDATNIKRNLYLTMQLLEMDTPMVIALNMMDEVDGNGGAIDINRLEAELGVPVVPISAAKRQGIEELVQHLLHIARYQEKPGRKDFCRKDGRLGAVHRAIHAAEAFIEDHAERASIPLRFAATKAIEGDPLILEQLALDQNERETLEHMIVQMESESGMDRSAAIASMRFDFITRVCEDAVREPELNRERRRSERLDRILTGKWTAIPCFILMMFLVFYLTFNVIGLVLQNLLAAGISYLSQLVDSALTGLGVGDTVHDLVIDGIFEGVGSVLSFIPIVVTFFFFLSILEDSGYIARVAFFMDKSLRKLGLSGRSIVPLLIGFGCSVPAVMATRTLPSSRDRKMTVMLTPFMSCSAKLPIYSFLALYFFPESAALVMIMLYILGIVVGVLVALLFKKTLFKGEAVPFIMELPNYRLPGAKNVLQLLWEKAKDFLTRAFSVIMVATIVIWVLQTFGPNLEVVEDSKESIMALVSGVLVPIFRPIGLGDWRLVTSLITGFMAKEGVVSTMQLLFGSNLSSVLSTSAAMAMLVFSLLYTPCVAAIAVIKRELGWRWALSVIVWQFVIAWLVALAARTLCIALGMGA